MIVDINIKQLGSLVTELTELINECDEAELNIFNQLKEACVNWQDGNSVEFEGKMKNEKKYTQNFLGAIQKNKDALRFAYDEYKAIGNKLYANLEKKSAIIKAVDTCISNANDVIYELDRAERGFYYYELTLINNQRSNMYTVRDNLKTMKSKLNELYKKIENAEARIATKVSKLESSITFPEFDFSLDGRNG